LIRDRDVAGIRYSPASNAISREEERKKEKNMRADLKEKSSLLGVLTAAMG